MTFIVGNLDNKMLQDSNPLAFSYFRDLTEIVAIIPIYWVSRDVLRVCRSLLCRVL